MFKERFSEDCDYINNYAVGFGLLKPEKWFLAEDKGSQSEVGLEFIYKNIPNINNPKHTWEELVPNGI